MNSTKYHLHLFPTRDASPPLVLAFLQAPSASVWSLHLVHDSVRMVTFHRTTITMNKMPYVQREGAWKVRQAELPRPLR